MTISTTTVRVAYDGDNVTTTFAVPFPFFAASELEVIERNIALGTETPKVLGTHYTVAGGDGATGTVTASTPPSSAVQWVVRRKTARTQATDYTPNDPFPAETHEKALDRLTMIGQELGEESDRALAFPKTDAGGLSPTLPPSVARAGRVLAFDDTGVPAVSSKTLTQLESEADNAAASATAAASSASVASSSATAAATSATNAATSATAANASAVVAAAVAEKNVKSYGAVGDGITDDTAAFTAAIAAAASGVLTVPEGTFIVTGITIDVQLELRLRAGATIKQKANTAANLITVSHNDVTIKGGTLDGNRANQTSTNNQIVQCSVQDRFCMDSVTVENAKSFGVRIVDSNDVTIRNCIASNTGATAFQFFATTQDVYRNVVVEGVIDRSTGSNNDGGNAVQMAMNGTGKKFYNSGIRDVHVKMPSTPTTPGDWLGLEIWGGSERSFIENCHVDAGGCATAISFNAVTSGIINGCTTLAGISFGIELASSPDCTVSGNTVDGNSTCAIGIAFNNSTSNGGVATSNTVRRLSTTSSVGIYIDSIDCAVNGNVILSGNSGIEFNGADSGVVNGNKLLNTSASGVGIWMIECSNYVVNGNWVSWGGNAIQIVASAGPIRDNISVQGNYCKSATANNFTNTGSHFGQNVLVALNPNVGAGNATTFIGLNLGNGNILAMGNAADGTGNGNTVPCLWLRRDYSIGGQFWIQEQTGGTGWYAAQVIRGDTTANRPTPGSTRKGYRYFDTDLGKPIWWDGAAWHDANGLTPKGASLEGSKTYDAPSLATSTTTTTTITVTGAGLGDYAQASLGVDLAGLVCTAYVSAADTVTVVLFNPTSGAVDLASTTLRVRVVKQ